MSIPSPKKRRVRVYVAGPISKGRLEDNIKQATEAGVRLIQAGFAPLVPQLTCYMGGPNPHAAPSDISHKEWLDVDLPWVAASDAVLRLPGESAGAEVEVSWANYLDIPVYDDIGDLISHPPVLGDDRYERLLLRMWQLHCKKAADYGTDEDLFANIRASQEWGIPPWLGALLRAGDKVRRLKTYAEKGTLANEGVEDSMMDNAAYNLIALILFQEAQASAGGATCVADGTAV